MAKPSVWEELPEPSPYQMVDLGLPSGLKWADRNVGAASPEAYGDYFMWGSTTPDTDNVCDWAHAPFNNGSSSFDKTYFGTVSATVCPGGVLASEYDAATQIMGGSWRMPTSADIFNLINGTTRSVEEVNGISGLRFTSKVNDNSIFIPFCGHREGSGFIYVGINAYAWSSSIHTGVTYNSYYLGCGTVGKDNIYNDYRRFGCVVRGVCQ